MDEKELEKRLAEAGVEVKDGRIKESDVEKTTALLIIAEPELDANKCECCGSPSEDAICDACTKKGWWMDPAGTVHHRDDDPLKAYE